MSTHQSRKKNVPVIHSFMKVPGYKEIRDRFTYPEGDVSNIVEPKNATEIDRFKIKLCHLIDGYRIERLYGYLKTLNPGFRLSLEYRETK